MHLFLLALALVMPAMADTALYVAPNGSDADPGTLQSPFATLTKAETKSAV